VGYQKYFFAQPRGCERLTRRHEPSLDLMRSVCTQMAKNSAILRGKIMRVFSAGCEARRLKWCLTQRERRSVGERKSRTYQGRSIGEGLSSRASRCGDESRDLQLSLRDRAIYGTLEISRLQVVPVFAQVDPRGIRRLKSASFFSRLHAFNCFSRAIAFATS